MGFDLFLVIPNETATMDDFGSTGSNQVLSPMFMISIAVIGALVAIFAVVIIAMKRKLDDKSRNMQYATYQEQARTEELYDFVNENMVCTPLRSIFSALCIPILTSITLEY